ncbi:unnamed protein product [Lactuca saligna]|uniref:Uncharacterized protein n=1 Tax=Lactuca saligna TaxID=75948 RepID=A0AA35V6Z5_LACSI|nr:unnamed protein product [Lactuca saligna]
MEKEQERKQWTNTARWENTKARRLDFIDRPREGSFPGFDEAKKEDGEKQRGFFRPRLALRCERGKGPMGQSSQRRQGWFGPAVKSAKESGDQEGCEGLSGIRCSDNNGWEEAGLNGKDEAATTMVFRRVWLVKSTGSGGWDNGIPASPFWAYSSSPVVAKRGCLWVSCRLSKGKEEVVHW